MEHVKEVEVKDEQAVDTKKTNTKESKTFNLLKPSMGIEVTAKDKNKGVTATDIGVAKLIKTAYVIKAIIQDDDLDIKFTGKNIKFEFMDTKIVTDAEDFFVSEREGSEDIYIKIKDVNDLFQYITVQVMKHTGMDRHLDRCVAYEDLIPACRTRLERIVKQELKGADVKTLFTNMCLSVGTPAEVGKELRVPSRLIKNIRVENRRRIIEWAKQEGIKEYNLNARKGSL